MLPTFFFTWGIALLYLVRHTRSTTAKKILSKSTLQNPISFTLLFALVLTGGVWAARANIGGDVNTLLPAYAAVGLVFGLLAGKQTYAHSVPIEELAGFFGNQPDSTGDPGILNDLQQAITDKQFAAIILDNPDEKLLSQPVGYQDSGKYAALEAADVFFSVSPYKPKTRLKIWTVLP